MDATRLLGIFPYVALGAVCAYLFYVERRVRLLRRHQKRMDMARRLPYFVQ